MQLKTAIILSVLTAASTTTFAAPIDSHVSELSRREEDLHLHYARDFDEGQDIEARGLSPEEGLQIRSPSSPGHMPAHSFGMPSGHSNNFGGLRRKFHSPSQNYNAYGFPGGMQQHGAPSPSPDLQVLKVRSPQDPFRNTDTDGTLNLHPEQVAEGRMGMGGMGMRRKGMGRNGQSGYRRKGRPGSSRNRRISARGLSGDVQELGERSPSLDGELEKRSRGGLEAIMNKARKYGRQAKSYTNSKGGKYAHRRVTSWKQGEHARSLAEDVELVDRKSVV